MRRNQPGSPVLLAEVDNEEAAARRLDDGERLFQRFPPCRDHREAVGEEGAVEGGAAEKRLGVEARRVAKRERDPPLKPAFGGYWRAPSTA